MLRKLGTKISRSLGDKLLGIGDALDNHDDHGNDHCHNEDDYEFERQSWGDCCNTFGEDIKHYSYARHLGLKRRPDYNFESPAAKIVDIGGGPTSMLLKLKGLSEGLVVDPISYPNWTIERYKAKNIQYLQMPGEKFAGSGFDEAWIYNCLQHSLDPELIINNALKSAKFLRIFEWIDIPAHEGHPHELTEAKLNEWIRGSGKTTVLRERFCRGKAYFGVFRSPYHSQ